MAAPEEKSTHIESTHAREGGSQNQSVDLASLGPLFSQIERLIQTLRQGGKLPSDSGMPVATTGMALAEAGPHTSGAGTPGGGTSASTGTGGERIEPRRPQYMLSPSQTAALETLSADSIVQHLASSPEISIVKKIEPPRLLGLASVDGPPLGPLVLARMAPKTKEELEKRAGSRLVVERDLPLIFSANSATLEARMPNVGVVVPHAEGFSVTFEVVGAGGPLAGADIMVFGSVWPAQAVTDASGRVTMAIQGESPDTIAGLYVKPKLDHWGFWLDRPRLIPASVNTISLKPLNAYLRDFPDRQLLGWGQRAMGLDRVPASFDGAGIKIAVIDSGAAQTHRNLQRVGPGVSIVGENRGAWTQDTIGHGSHCAGIIAGGPVGTGGGIRGFAPAAEIHVIRIFPGGRFSDLVGAIDYCIENGIDVANMSLGGGEASRILEERIVRAKEMGMACIVAAGNSAGQVQFPASSQHALAVAAMGKFGEYPEDSFHARQVLDGFPRSRAGYFPAKFSCFGPEIDVCAPGVAIISSLPANGFGAWDGTSMAAPHVTGLAALILAHHPDFSGSYQGKDSRRVERLFQIIKETATPLPFGEPNRTGAGLPNAPRALGLDTAGAAAGPARVPDASFEALRKLLAIIAQRGGSGGLAPQEMGMANVFWPPTAPAPPISRGPARTNGGFNPLLYR